MTDEKNMKFVRNAAVILWIIGMFRWFFGGPEFGIYLVIAFILITIYYQKKGK